MSHFTLCKLIRAKQSVQLPCHDSYVYILLCVKAPLRAAIVSTFCFVSHFTEAILTKKQNVDLTLCKAKCHTVFEIVIFFIVFKLVGFDLVRKVFLPKFYFGKKTKFSFYENLASVKMQKYFFH